MGYIQARVEVTQITGHPDSAAFRNARLCPVALSKPSTGVSLSFLSLAMGAKALINDKALQALASEEASGVDAVTSAGYGPLAPPRRRVRLV